MKHVIVLLCFGLVFLVEGFILGTHRISEWDWVAITIMIVIDVIIAIIAYMPGGVGEAMEGLGDAFDGFGD
jgi:phosphoglycerol transferase MdoB-like AlkP superfamily enzyme